MRSPLFAAAILAVALVGCKGREAQVPGTWSSNALTMTFKDDKSFEGNAGMLKIGGKWRFADDKVWTKTETVNGQPVAAFVKQLEANPMIAEMIKKSGKNIDEELKKEGQLTLDKDGKTLVAKDPASGQSVTLTKSETK